MDLDTVRFDVNAYFARIGYAGPAAPDLTTLAALAQQHPAAIPFENLNPLLGTPVPLDVASLQQKLVQGRRGGWCYEHNLLFGTALRALGFTVTGLAARVLWNVPAGVVRPRSHMVLLVDIGRRRFIADAGFGGLTLTAPLRLEAGVEQDTPHEPFRLTSAGSDFIVEAAVRGEWKALYRFDLQPQALADYEVANWYLCHHPQSHFLTTLIAARALPDRRYALHNSALTVHHLDGYTERRVLTDATDMAETLEQIFGIEMPTSPDVETIFARLAAAAPPAAV